MTECWDGLSEKDRSRQIERWRPKLKCFKDCSCITFLKILKKPIVRTRFTRETPVNLYPAYQISSLIYLTSTDHKDPIDKF